MKTLTADTKIKLSQIKDLQTWAKDEAAPEGAVHHWSNGDHVKKNGKWVPLEENNSSQETRTLSANTLIKIRPSKEAATINTPATAAQVKKLRKYSCEVELGQLDKHSTKVITDTVVKMIKDFKMKPLSYIKTFKGPANKMGNSDGLGISFNEVFMANPSQYYKEMINDQQRAKESLKNFTFIDFNGYSREEVDNIHREIKKLCVRSNVIYEGKEIECVTLHEMAHVLSQQKIKMLSKTKTPDVIKINKMVLQTYFNAMLTGDIDNISQYARRNRKEFFAEAFVIYKMGKEQLPEYIKNMVEEVIK